MNYCIVAFAIIMVISTIQWFVDGRKNFKGPYIDPETLQQARLAGLSTGDTNLEREAAGETNGAGVGHGVNGDENGLDGKKKAF